MPDDADADHDTVPPEAFDDHDDAAVYIAECRSCDTHVQVTDILVEDVDGDLEPYAVELACGHHLGIDTGLDGEDDE